MTKRIHYLGLLLLLFFLVTTGWAHLAHSQCTPAWTATCHCARVRVAAITEHPLPDANNPAV